jgi:hypothetical protein
MNNTNNIIKVFFIYLALTIIIGVPFALVNGIWPKNITGWVIIFLFCFPLLLLGEYLSEKLFSKKISSSLDPSHKEKVISLKRMTYALVVGIIIAVFITSLVYFFRDNIGKYFIVA